VASSSQLRDHHVGLTYVSYGDSVCFGGAIKLLLTHKYTQQQYNN
jgi:hypothetical protein